VLKGGLVGPTHAVNVSPTFVINADNAKDAAAVKDTVEKAVAKFADDLDRSVSSRLHARTRSTGMRGT
jgi:hypothetical protein